MAADATPHGCNRIPYRTASGEGWIILAILMVVGSALASVSRTD
jgi:hypothetical protein